MPHIHELYDFTASAYIVFENKILLVHHKRLNTWLQPGGHIELDEDPEEALWREIEEEVGLKKSDLVILNQPERPKALDHRKGSSKRLPLPFDLNVHNYSANPGHKHIDFCYLMRAKQNTVRISDESSDIRWFSLKDIETEKENLLPNVYNRCLFVLKATKQ